MTGAVLLNLSGAGIFAVMLFAIMGAMIFLAIFLAWIKFGRKIISGLALLSVPFYLLWKIPIYLSFLFKPEKNWTRTQRDSENALRPPDS
jgi:hypothetical protein